ncbi:MAG: fibronectin type III domain-containing protein [Bacteroidetes bacterium]|nr:fibronectin type III domain-containing protein [Bacteroidota bacterium]
MKHNNSLRSAFFLQALFLFVVSISFGQTNILSGISNGNSKSTSTSNASVTRMDSSSTENFVSTAAWFRTSGSCAAPNGVSSTVLSSTSARLNWTAKTGIMYYNFRYRRTGTSSWTYDSTITNSKTIYGLAASTSYDYQIQTRCNSSSTSGYGTRKLLLQQQRQLIVELLMWPCLVQLIKLLHPLQFIGQVYQER